MQVCNPGAVLSLLEQNCDFELVDQSSPVAADRCCEQLGLLNSALCFCDPALSTLTRQLKFRLWPMFAAAPEVCGFDVYAREVSEENENASSSSSGGTCSPVPSSGTIIVRIPPPPSSMSPAPPLPPSQLFPSPPLPPSPRWPPRPPRPPRPPMPSQPSPPPPRSPAGPRGPPGPPGATIVVAGGERGEEVEKGSARQLGSPRLFTISDCPPWLHSCRWLDEGNSRSKWKKNEVFPSRPRLPPALGM